MFFLYRVDKTACLRPCLLACERLCWHIGGFLACYRHLWICGIAWHHWQERAHAWEKQNRDPPMEKHSIANQNSSDLLGKTSHEWLTTQLPMFNNNDGIQKCVMFIDNSYTVAHLWQKWTNCVKVLISDSRPFMLLLQALLASSSKWHIVASLYQRKHLWLSFIVQTLQRAVLRVMHYKSNTLQ